MPPTCGAQALRTSASAGSTRQLLCFLRGQAVPKRASRKANTWLSVGTMVAAGTCCGRGCQTHDSETRSKGMALPGRHLLRHEKWERHVCKETGFRQNPRCPRDTDGRCLSRTMEDGTSYRDSTVRRVASAPRHQYVGQLIEEQTPPPTHTRTALSVACPATLKAMWRMRSTGICTEGEIMPCRSAYEPSYISAARSHGTIVVL